MTGPTPTGPGGGLPGGDPLAKSCTSQACVGALAGVVDARNAIIFKCGQVAAAKGRRDMLASVALTLSGIAVALFAAAAVATATIVVFGFTIIVANLLFWLGVTVAATALVFWTLSGIAAIQVLVLEGELSDARSKFIAAADRVTSSCPPSCWGDTTMPGC